MPPLDSSSPTARTSTRQESQNVVGNGVAALVVRAAGRSRSGRRARSAPRRPRAHAAAGRAGARSPRGHAPSQLPRAEVSHPGPAGRRRVPGATAQTAKPCRCRLAPAPPAAPACTAPAVSERSRCCCCWSCCCVGPVRSYLRARTATQQLRTEVTQLDRTAREAAGRAEERIADARALIAQARAEGYIRPGEKPFALTPLEALRASQSVCTRIVLVAPGRFTFVPLVITTRSPGPAMPARCTASMRAQPERLDVLRRIQRERHDGPVEHQLPLDVDGSACRPRSGGADGAARPRAPSRRRPSAR